ncbi:sterol desaturase family protein [Roseivirga sp. UBA838]|uniref:sterol desaturase family protein n=1 Tax=Roseivirga sp. UBA838 TaxID=1947393 RepID=UPI00257BE85B|nr:sterol desaturase family protein [Roseivirga sp. UBA838]|tara:strand:+ start:18674 stop:19456 length:783 start_codon:yes stop_codon:yes gene_type:complete
MSDHDFTQPQNFLILTGLMFLVVVFRYSFVAGIFYLVFYVIDPKSTRSRKIFSSGTSKKQFRKEIFWSTFTSMLFALAGAGMVVMWQLGYTAIYEEIDRFGWWWVPTSFLIAAFIHETYYYWLHRWMHKPRVYRLIHKTHHDSHITSPWTSFSFHPGEGLLQSLIIPVIVLFLPMHYWTIVALLTFMTITSAINHSNVEIYPKGFHKHWLGKWFIGATHHSLHHTQYKYNFGLYFTFWDKLMRTESEKYESNFEKHTANS